jgi:hypothetical protein
MQVADPVVYGLDGARPSSDKTVPARLRDAVLSTKDLLAQEVRGVHEQWKEEGALAAARHAAATTLGRASSAAASVVPETAVLSSALEFGLVATSRACALAKPYVEKALEHPSVERVVGTVREAAVGAGTMVMTKTKLVAGRLEATRGQLDAMRGRTPEAEAAAEAEAEAWRQVLAGNGWVVENSSSSSSSLSPGSSRNVRNARNGSSSSRSSSSGSGQELVVPAGTTATSSFAVPAGALLQWRFRVAGHDVGFALRLRVQGDGGSSEVDVFGMQRYASGVTVQGAWSPSTDSQLIVVWDNSYSYIREKIVAFQTAVRCPLPPNLD